MKKLAASSLGGLAAILLSSASLAQPARPFAVELGPGENAWRNAELGAIRGLTVGPIESEEHRERGYGSEHCSLAMHDARTFGANWVSITPFGRIYGLQPTGVALSYQAPYEQNREAVRLAIHQAHDAGLKVMLVPHLWVETGEWRGFIDPGDDAGWDTWSNAYLRFVRLWATLARDTGVELFVAGVELRSWVTTSRAPSFVEVIQTVREVYPGLVTYAANWDDVHDTVIWGELDLIGINAFFPLAKQKGAGLDELLKGGRRIAAELEQLAKLWQRPILFTEFGYTTRADPALEPWLWPEHLSDVVLDELAQANAYRALLSSVVRRPWFAGGFVWRVFSDPYDLSQEPEWGFSPRGKLAELVLKDAYRAGWASDGPASPGFSWARRSATQPHLVGMKP